MTILYNKKLSKLVIFIFSFLVILVLTFISALLEIARCSTDKDVLQAIYEIGIEKNDKVFFLELAINRSPAIKEILEEIGKNKALLTELRKITIANSGFASNPYTPEYLLEICLQEHILSDALYNPNTPARALNKCFPELLKYKRYICEKVVKENGEKLSDEVLKMIIETYPDFLLPKQILAERK